jgi:hypothetical protein
MKQPVERRLAAILAADVAGYSRLMGVDEEGTHQRLKAHIGQLVDPKITERRGCTVKNTGDGLLAEFASVVDAVRCAAEVQRGMIDRDPAVPDERRIRFRIGTNRRRDHRRGRRVRSAGWREGRSVLQGWHRQGRRSAQVRDTLNRSPSSRVPRAGSFGDTPEGHVRH